MAILAGVSADQAVSWVRANYHPHAVENPAQEQWVQWFAGYIQGRAIIPVNDDNAFRPWPWSG